MTWNLNVDDFHGKQRYDMILGYDILSKIKMDLCFSENTIRENGGA